MAKKVSETISDELEVLRTEIKLITDNDEAADDEIARADVLLEEFKTKSAARDKALAREAAVEDVMRASLNPTNRETSVRKGPEVMKRTEAYDEGSYKSLIRSINEGGSFDKKDAISRASAAIENAPRHVNDAAKERMFDLVENGSKHSAGIARHMLVTGSPEYHNQFEEYMQGGYVGDMLRASMSLTDANGGYLVPFTLDPTIILTNAGIADPIRSISTVKTIVTDTWNGVASDGVTAEWTAEASVWADASPAFTQPTITPKKADIYITASYEVLQDSGFAAELGRLLADAKARHEGAAFATGNTGATVPRGVLAAVVAVTAQIVTSATTGALVVGDVYNTGDAVRPRSASQASFIANKKVFTKIRQFDTAGGGSFWANLGMGRPQELLGQPVYECSTMTGTIGNGNNVLVVGDFSQYCIVDRVGMTVLYNPIVLDQGTARPKGQGGYAAFWRVGADVLDVKAFNVLQLNQVAAAVALG